MATANLYLVTRTLQRLLELNVTALLAAAGMSGTVNVTAMPPERVGSQANTLNLHLYHVMEDAHYKNQPPPGGGHPPIARQPLVLSLFYILTAHHDSTDAFEAETQQLFLGLAMKTMHDHPIIIDSLAISPDGGPPEVVMPPALLGGQNRIEVSLRPLTPEESISFWSSDQTATARLAAYYEVRTIIFEPELPLGLPGLVYDVGLFVGAGEAPRIDRVSSVLGFTPPPASGLPPQAIAVSPARATLATGLPLPVNRVELRGSRLAGDGRPGGARIVLRNARWRQLDPPVRAAPIDPALNPQWAVDLNESRARFDLDGTLRIDDGGRPVDLEVAPGIYAVSVEALRHRQAPTGSGLAARSESTQVPFSVGARITAVDPPGANGRMKLRVANLFDMTADEVDVQLAIDGVLYSETIGFDGSAAADRGHFERQAGAIEFHPLFNPAVAGAHPLRLIVNGGESQPFWVLT